MTFEEFFNKKRIDLTALQAGEPALFAEFRTHFEQMGEKSFDHTKKYWFNKLRLRYHLAPQLKPEKVHLENRLAEQTIIETLSETKPTAEAENDKAQSGLSGEPQQPIAKPAGFKPRFNAGAIKQPSVPVEPTEKDSATVTPEVNDAAALKDQLPQFEQDKQAVQAKADASARPADDTPTPSASTGAKPSGFKPRFNMKMASGNVPQSKDLKPEEAGSENSEGAKSGEYGAEATAKVQQDAESVDHAPVQAQQPIAPKPAGFKPRFNAAKMKGVQAESAKVSEDESGESKDESAEPKADSTKISADTSETDQAHINAEAGQTANEGEQPAPSKPAGFKPRFNAAKMKPKPPQE